MVSKYAVSKYPEDGHGLKQLKDVRAKMFYSIDFFKLLLRTDNNLLVSEMK